MKRMIAILTLAALSIPMASQAAWHSEGPKSGVVTANTVLADCGFSSGDGGRQIELVISASIAAAFNLERRNSTDTATIDTYPLFVNGGTLFWKPTETIQILDGEKYRITLRTAIAAGTVNAMIGACE